MMPFPWLMKGKRLLIKKQQLLRPNDGRFELPLGRKKLQSESNQQMSLLLTPENDETCRINALSPQIMSS